MNGSRSDDAGCDSTGSQAAATSRTDAHGHGAKQRSVVERLSSYGTQVLPGAFERRSRLQRQHEVASLDGCAPGGALHREAPERGSLTPAMRKKYLKDLLFSNGSGFSSALSSQTDAGASPEQQDEDAEWALCPMEHAWMLSAVEGSYDTILEFVSEDPYLLTRRDFVSGYTVLHWLAKRGQDDTLLRLLRFAEAAGTRVNVDVRGSGGLTPLHLASMHRHYMVIKLLVGAFGANVDVMDYNGRRAWQYLSGDAPPEMKELLGMWDDEHCCGGGGGVGGSGAVNVTGNVNNNSAGSGSPSPRDEVEGGHEDEVDYFDRTQRSGSWRFGSLKKKLNAFFWR